MGQLTRGSMGVCLAACVAVGACAPGEITRSLGLDNTPASYDDRTDGCYTERQALALSEDYFAEELISVALATGVVSMGATLAAGGSVEQGLLVGLITAVGVGAAGTYWEHVGRNSGDSAETLFSAVAYDLGQETEEIRRFEQRLSTLVTCRQQQAGDINQRYTAGTINRAEADIEMAEVRERFREDITYAQQINRDLGARSDELIYASGQVDEMVTRDRSSGAARSQVITPSAQQAARETQTAALSNQNARMNTEEFLEEDMIGAL